MEAYKTVRSEGCGEYEIKRSRFLCYACPVQTAEEAQAFIARIKSKHWDARHNCSAYILREGGVKRYSDDGEPQGTAGMPILDVLEKSGVTDVCVVITRYFGGILLGAGGLVRAYSHSATLALEAGEVITMTPCTVCRLTCDYTLYGRIPSLLAEHGGKETGTDFTDNVTVTCLLPEASVEGFRAKLTELSSGKVDVDVLETTFEEL
ncbi:MAG: YigZ family protein [Clostridia bacterium]|nr:YigZ family protein [Clostridia bacterium]